MVLKCDECCYLSHSNSSVKNHKRSVHSDLRPWPCPQPGCDYRAKLKGTLKRHSRAHGQKTDQRKPLPCTFENCEYRAAVKATLNDHITAAHTPDRTRDFLCPLCPSAFYTHKHLRRHAVLHTNERKKFPCEKCDFSTQYKTCLQDHVRARHETWAKFKCSFHGCHFETPQRGILQRHSRQSHHSDPGTGPVIRPVYRCKNTNCTYSTCFSSDLIKHANVRHNPNRARQFQCPMCPNRFYDRGGLRSHINHIHTNQWNFKCDECEYVSKSSSNFYKHRQEAHVQGVAAPEAIFKCPSCDYRSKRKYHVSRHQRTVHSRMRTEMKCTNLGCGLQPCQISKSKDRTFESHEDFQREDTDPFFQSSLSHRIPVVMLGKICLEIV